MSQRKLAITVSAFLLLSSAMAAAELPLTALLVPDGKTLDLNFTRSSRAPSKASMSATVKMEKAQATVDLRFDKMEPAILFAGDFSTYVLWAVAIDGTVDNLGEVFVDRKDCSGSQPFFTTRKIFALVVTAEPYAATNRPTEVVLFTSGGVVMSGVKTTPFTFKDFAAGPKPALDSIAGFQYSDDTPVTYKQAQKVVEAANKMNAAEVNPNAMRDAQAALASADNAFKARAAKKTIIDFSRVAVQMASQGHRQSRTQRLRHDQLATVHLPLDFLQHLETLLDMLDGLAIVKQHLELPQRGRHGPPRRGGMSVDPSPPG